MILAAALFLTGVAPSFAEDSKSSDIKPSAKISWDDAPTVEGTSAIVIDAGSGAVLYEKNSKEKRDPASITKIMTCLVVLETMELDEEVTAAVAYDPSTGGTGIKIEKGEVFTVEQLLYALMLPSANDAAEVLAIAAGGSIDNFCEMMNERAKRCGAKDTNFTNPNGLNVPAQPNHKTTAYDLTLISMEAMKNETFRKIVSTVDYKIPATNKSGAREITNTNRCLSDG
ncbi:MAG: D-alanyl-D-alanine carboxypeptidase, partial [Firmicutes bacterium]|nr:D-alanyl-D-alanine carboxypeptidase [Bacillota bacterium]